jgi:hypothetical protein
VAQGWIAAAVAGLLALPAACDLPRDPFGTRNAVRGETLVAGVVAPALTAAEEAALGALARDLGAELLLVPGDVHAGLSALDRGEAHVLAGGIPESTPCADRAALSKPIGRERYVLMLRRGENAMLLAANRAVAGTDGAAP